MTPKIKKKLKQRDLRHFPKNSPYNEKWAWVRRGSNFIFIVIAAIDQVSPPAQPEWGPFLNAQRIAMVLAPSIMYSLPCGKPAIPTIEAMWSHFCMHYHVGTFLYALSCGAVYAWQHAGRQCSTHYHVGLYLHDKSLQHYHVWSSVWLHTICNHCCEEFESFIPTSPATSMMWLATSHFNLHFVV